MGCLPCRGNSNATKKLEKMEVQESVEVDPIKANSGKLKVNHTTVQPFSFRELATATRKFSAESLLGEGVFKGHLQSINQIVAIKHQREMNSEFVVEVLSHLHHPNLIDLIGYCDDGGRKLIIYEYMPLGSLEDHLHGVAPGKQPLDWNTRMKIAAGVASGLEYLHHQANPPIIYRNLKCSNILLGEGYHPKLSDFKLSKVGPVGENTSVFTRVMGTIGYCAPEYAMTGLLTPKSDIYSFGVVLLEIITGKKATHISESTEAVNLVAWARPFFMDRRKMSQMADQMLQGQYPPRGLEQAIAVAAMCVQEEANLRPVMADVALALNYLASQRYDPNTQAMQSSCLTPVIEPSGGNDVDVNV